MITIHKLGPDFKFHEYDTWDGGFSGPLSGLDISEQEVEKRFNSSHYITTKEPDVEKFEIPDELLEAIDIDPKKMSPKQIKAMFAKLKEKGLLNDKPGDKKPTGGKSADKEPEGAQGSRPGLVKKKVTVRRDGKTFEQERWVKAGEDEPTEKPGKGEDAPDDKSKKGDDTDTGEATGEVPGEQLEPEKPKGPAIMGLNKPEDEIEGDSKDFASKLKVGDWVNVGGRVVKVKSVDDDKVTVGADGSFIPDETFDFDRLNKIGAFESSNPDKPEIPDKETDIESVNDELSDDVCNNFIETGEITIGANTKAMLSELNDPHLDVKRFDQIKTVMDKVYSGSDKLSTIHTMIRSGWFGTSNSDLSGVLKDSLSRTNKSPIVHHDAVNIDDWKNHIENVYKIYQLTPADVDEYVGLQKKLTRSILDSMYPDTDEIKVYRGTTKQEIDQDIKFNDVVDVKQNPVSSWTVNSGVSIGFATKPDGFVIEKTIKKDDIWASFYTHAWSAMEQEIYAEGGKDDKAKISWTMGMSPMMSIDEED